MKLMEMSTASIADRPTALGGGGSTSQPPAPRWKRTKKKSPSDGTFPISDSGYMGISTRSQPKLTKDSVWQTGGTQSHAKSWYNKKSVYAQPPEQKSRILKNLRHLEPAD